MTGALWAFSLRVYARPGVADALLALQNAHGADVNLLLYCAWHAASGRGALSVERVAVLDARLAPWRTAVIAALRDVRERIKGDAALAELPGSGEARAGVLDAELACERVAQQLLESLTETDAGEVSGQDAAAALDASLTACFTHLGLPPDAGGPVRAALRAEFRNN